jgi:hypothetical protein
MPNPHPDIFLISENAAICKLKVTWLLVVSIENTAPNC